MVGIQCRDHALNWVVEQNRTHTDAHVGFETMSSGEERLELADRFALVVEHRPAGTDPARTDFRTAFDEWSRLRLNLFLDLAAEAIGVDERMLDLGLLSRRKVSVVGLPRQRVRNRGFRFRLVLSSIVGEQIVNQARGGALQYRMRVDEGIVQMR